MPAVLKRVLSPADLPEAELCAARLDGEAFAIGAGLSPIDLPEGLAGRAAALCHDLPARLIAELMSAAWVWMATDAPPRVHQFCSSADARAKPTTHPGRAIREVQIDQSETVTIGSLRVTSPLRTACDLVRSSGDFDDAAQAIVLRLLERGGNTLDQCVGVLAVRRNLPGKRRTLGRLEALRSRTERGAA